MKWMQCTTCRKTVKLNNTGTCLGCQGGFDNKIDSDHLKLSPGSLESIKKILNQRKKELEHELEDENGRRR